MHAIWSKLSEAALLLALASSFASAAEIASTDKALEPMAYAHLIEGEIWKLQDADGKPLEMRMEKVSDGMVTIARSDGCSWTRVEDGFPPSSTWRNCGGADGSHEITRNGNIYPLSVGATETWTYRGKDERGNKWRGKRICEVEEVVEITVPAGSFDAYHVECNDPDWVRHFYVAPELQRIVLFSRKHRRQDGREHMELVDLVKP